MQLLVRVPGQVQLRQARATVASGRVHWLSVQRPLWVRQQGAEPLLQPCAFSRQVLRQR